jgi:hypothetical protein
MNTISKYFLVYLIAVIFGLIVESISIRKPFCFSPFDLSCFLKGIFLNGCGIFLVLLTFIYQISLSKYIHLNQISSLILLFIILFISVAVFECLIGQISYINHGGIRTWNYDKYGCTTCNGYIALGPTLLFSVGLFLYFIFIYPMIFGKE